MEEKLKQIYDILGPGLYVVAIVSMIAEGILLRWLKERADVKHGVISMLSGLFAFGSIALAQVLYNFAIISWFYQHRLFTLGFQWYVWIACFLLYDFMFYWLHRWSHEVRLLWCIHSVHHTSDEMRLTSGIRGSMFDFVLSPVFFIWMPLLGFHPMLFLITETVSKLWGLFEHVNIRFINRLPILDKLFITPSVHRVHHGKEIKYLDKNYSEIFLFWDYIFGTYTPEEELPTYGVLSGTDPRKFSDSQFAAFRSLWNDLKRADTFGDRLKYLFFPPGWSHDGEDKRTKTLRKYSIAG